MVEVSETRIANKDTVQPDITAYELWLLMLPEVTYGPDTLAAMTPEHRALVERNSRPKDD